MNTITASNMLFPTVWALTGWVAVLLAGGLGGALSATILLWARERRARLAPLRRLHEPDFDDTQIDAVAEEWAKGSGRPWAAGIVADKLRLLARIERSRSQHDQFRPHREGRRSERAARRVERRRFERDRRRDVRRARRGGWW